MSWNNIMSLVIWLKCVQFFCGKIIKEMCVIIVPLRKYKFYCSHTFLYQTFMCPNSASSRHTSCLMGHSSFRFLLTFPSMDVQILLLVGVGTSKIYHSNKSILGIQHKKLALELKYLLPRLLYLIQCKLGSSSSIPKILI